METLTEVLKVIQRCDTISVSIDESSTSSRDRVLNYCITTPSGTFCMKQDVVAVRASTAERQRDWLETQLESLEAELKEVCGKDVVLSPINSVFTDTCATIRKMWEHCKAKPRFEHTFFIPCDSHGLQLLIQDIIELDLYVETMASCNHISAHFRFSHKQLAFLQSL